MFTRILTAVERAHIRKYLRSDGEKEIGVRKIVYGARKHLTQIRSDIELLERLLTAYEWSKRK